MWLSTDRPRQPAAVTLQNVLPGVAGDELAAVALAVDLGAPVPVNDAGPQNSRSGGV